MQRFCNNLLQIHENMGPQPLQTFTKKCMPGAMLNLGYFPDQFCTVKC